MNKLYFLLSIAIFSSCNNYFGAGKSELSNRLQINGSPFTQSRDSFKQTIEDVKGPKESQKVIFIGPKTTFVFETERKFRYEFVEGQEVFARWSDNFWYTVAFFSKEKRITILEIERPKRDSIVILITDGKDKIRYAYTFFEGTKLNSTWRRA